MTDKQIGRLLVAAVLVVLPLIGVDLTVLSEFRTRGIEIPYPQREVTLLQGNSPEQTRNSPAL